MERGRPEPELARRSPTSTLPTRSPTRATQRVPGLLPLRRPRAPRTRAGLPDHHHHHRRRPALGHRRRQRHGRERQPPPQRERVRAVRGRGARSATPASRRPAGGPLLLDLERAQPPPLHQADQEAPNIYRNMVNAAIPQIRAANKNAKILVGEPAPVGRAPKAMGPNEFLRKWLCLNKRFKRTRPRAPAAAASRRSTRRASRTTRTAPPRACRRSAT